MNNPLWLSNIKKIYEMYPHLTNLKNINNKNTLLYSEEYIEVNTKTFECTISPFKDLLLILSVINKDITIVEFMSIIPLIDTSLDIHYLFNGDIETVYLTWSINLLSIQSLLEINDLNK